MPRFEASVDASPTPRAFAVGIFSDGDEFVSDCGAGHVGTADPTAWRAVNMNHHMTELIVNLAELYGIKVPTRRAARPEQASLFDDRANTQRVET